MQMSSVDPKKTSICAGIFHDDDHWKVLAGKTRYELPDHNIALDVDDMRRWLDRFDKSETWHRDVYGCTTAEFIVLNPRWDLRSWVGLLLEATVGAN